MWQQFLAEPDCRAMSATRPTVLVFPAPARKDMTAVERADELAEWNGRITGADLTTQALERFVRECARMEAEGVFDLRSNLDVVTRSVELRAGRKLMSLPLIGALARFAYRLRDRASSR
jgi:hypothetical protein